MGSEGCEGALAAWLEPTGLGNRVERSLDLKGCGDLPAAGEPADWTAGGFGPNAHGSSI